MIRASVKFVVFGTILSAVCMAQTKDTTIQQKADKSLCANVVALTGDVNLNCSTLSPSQAKAIKEIPAILKLALANQQYLSDILAKLEEVSRKSPLAVSSSEQTQNCNGSNCVQGTNYAPQTLNQYGPPKLSMTISQRDAVRDAMKPFAGLKVTIQCHDATSDSREFADMLSVALKSAGLAVEGPTNLTLISSGVIYPGFSALFSEDMKPAAEALAGALKSRGVIPDPYKGGSVPNAVPGYFEITISPNR